MDRYYETNLALWNRWARINQGTAFYDLEGFKAGKTSLCAVELEEVGDVRGKSLLHLQCHFGLDTLSWARMGARVTGVDFSDEAIRLARSLSQETGIEARFICSDIYDLPNALAEEFDIVFTSYGVLAWLRDIKRWAEIAARCLKPRGSFHLVEFHPFLYMLDEEQAATVTFPYFHSPEPLEMKGEGSYADRGADFRHTSYEWTHSLCDVINALIGAGLRLEFLHEFPYSFHNCWPFLEECGEGRWMIKGRPNSVPLMYSIKAVKEAA
jgi:SAM-dependent methyltransferase